MPSSSRSIVWSFNYAISGIVYTLRTQRNMRIHLVAAILTLIGALILRVSAFGLMGIAFAISLVFVTELINTAIEAAVDVATQSYDPLAKVAKDVAAGAVLVAATNALVVAYLVLFEPAQHVAREGLDFTKAAPTTLTAAALGLTLLLVIVLKALTREGTFVHGGWPSGHTALAFGAATSLAYLTNSVRATVLAFFIAVLVGQSRVEGEIHSIPQVILGGLLGTLTVTAVYQVFFR